MSPYSLHISAGGLCMTDEKKKDNIKNIQEKIILYQHLPTNTLKQKINKI